MAVLVPGGTISHNVRRITAIAWTAAEAVSVEYSVDAQIGSVTSEYMSEGVQQNREYKILLSLESAGATWAAAGSAFDNQRQAIIDGIGVSPLATNGWEDTVLTGLVVGDVVRVSDTVVSITCDANGALSISADQTISIDVPTDSVVSTSGTVSETLASNDIILEPTPSYLTICRWFLEQSDANRTQNCDGVGSNLYTGDHYTFLYACADSSAPPSTSLIFVDGTDFTLFDMSGACDSPTNNSIIRASLIDSANETRCGEFSNIIGSKHNMIVRGASYQNLGWTGSHIGFTIPALANPVVPTS